MRNTLVIAGAVLVALNLWGCGSDQAATSAEGRGVHFGTITGGKGQAKPRIHPPGGPPPKKPLVRDLKVGTGPVAHRGDTITVHYIAVDYKTGKERYENWPPTNKPKPFVFELGSGGVSDAWEEGIEGMRIGGRRELIVPSKLLFQNGTLDYVVELVRVKPAF
jgi:peptidylprolyl isomerase